MDLPRGPMRGAPNGGDAMKFPDAFDHMRAASAGLPGGDGRLAPWECYFRSISDSLQSLSGAHPVPGREEPADAMMRAMQRARRLTWLHARYAMGWSMFESIRIAVRFSDLFLDWARSGDPDLAALGPALEKVEHAARNSASVTSELNFVHQLMDVADSTELQLVEMEFALEALRRSEAAEGLTRAGWSAGRRRPSMPAPQSAKADLVPS
jgi:hypothetical protein